MSCWGIVCVYFDTLLHQQACYEFVDFMKIQLASVGLRLEALG